MIKSSKNSDKFGENVDFHGIALDCA